MIEKKIREILRLMKEYEPLQDYFKVVLSVYGSEIVVNLKPFDWEYYGESLDSTLDEVIKDLEEAIQEKDEEEREAKEEMEQRERDYWEVQGKEGICKMLLEVEYGKNFFKIG
jgi:hypothetical protein